MFLSKAKTELGNAVAIPSKQAVTLAYVAIGISLIALIVAAIKR